MDLRFRPLKGPPEPDLAHHARLRERRRGPLAGPSARHRPIASYARRAAAGPDSAEAPGSLMI